MRLAYPAEDDGDIRFEEEEHETLGVAAEAHAPRDVEDSGFFTARKRTARAVRPWLITT